MSNIFTLRQNVKNIDYIFIIHRCRSQHHLSWPGLPVNNIWLFYVHRSYLRLTSVSQHLLNGVKAESINFYQLDEVVMWWGFSSLFSFVHSPQPSSAFSFWNLDARFCCHVYVLNADCHCLCRPDDLLFGVVVPLHFYHIMRHIFCVIVPAKFIFASVSFRGTIYVFTVYSFTTLTVWPVFLGSLTQGYTITPNYTPINALCASWQLFSGQADVRN